MKHAKAALFVAVSLALSLLIAACGSPSSIGSASATTMKTARLALGGKSLTVLTALLLWAVKARNTRQHPPWGGLQFLLVKKLTSCSILAPQLFYSHGISLPGACSRGEVALPVTHL